MIRTQAWVHGNPYMRLQAFDPAHADVFFGRSHAIAQVLGVLRAQLHSQRGMVLVSGASGCGLAGAVQQRARGGADADPQRFLSALDRCIVGHR
ncbi:hypothetical protein B1H41_21170 [Xanthomonas vasicola pv. vasculorum]|nr:hypothetical protein B1H41_21170 [Xanthomonas vasicola pv. vasculorum]